MEASVLLAKCSMHNRTFGIRIEKRENEWMRTWAFPIDEAKARREGFDKTDIEGSLRAVDRYPGCPYCESQGFVQCGGCKRISCYAANGKYEGGTFHCHWCGRLIKVEEIVTAESFAVKSGDF